MSNLVPSLDLPPEMAALRPSLGEVLTPLTAGRRQAAVLLSSRQGMSIHIEKDEEQISELPRSSGGVVSCLDGQTLWERSVPGFDTERLRVAANELRDSLGGRGDGSAPLESPPPRDFATRAEIPSASLSLDEKLERCRDLQRRLAGMDPRIVNTRISYTEYSETSVYRDRASDLSQAVQRVRLIVFAVLSEGGEVVYDWKSKGSTAGWESLVYSDEELEDVVRGAVRLFAAERIDPGEHTVVSGPGVSGVLAHESFGHGVETDLFPKERARSVDYLGRKVGSEHVTIIDDPSFPTGFGSYFFDDEGMPAAPTVIVERGIFRSGITDRVSAATLGIERTSNGRRQDYTRKPYARMSNTFFGAGTSSVEDILGQVDRGIYLDRWVNGMEDPQGWGIQITCHYGREIRDGRLTDRVFAPVSISGYVPTVLGTISAASSTIDLDQGMCGKGKKEYVVNSSGGPHLLLRASLG